MCLGIPMKIRRLEKDIGVVESGGVRRSINVSLVKDLKIGDYVIVHAGFAIEKVHEGRAKETLQILKDMSLR